VQASPDAVQELPGKNEPLLWAVEAGAGRVFATMIGHSAQANPLRRIPCHLHPRRGVGGDRRGDAAGSCRDDGVGHDVRSEGLVLVTVSPRGLRSGSFGKHHRRRFFIARPANLDRAVSNRNQFGNRMRPTTPVALFLDFPLPSPMNPGLDLRLGSHFTPPLDG
jgi:hypothetical protein